MRFARLLILSIVFFCLVALSSFPAPAQTTVSDVKIPDDVDLIISGTFAERRIVGKVVGVHDGDTATVLDNEKTRYKIRFNGIDAPELKQDFGNKSKQNLSNLIFGKEVTVIFNKVDKYNRFVGKIMVNGIDANLEQIKAGLAWHYKKYASEQSEIDRKTYSDAEIKARNAKLGFWMLPNPIPAWDYRAEKKVKQEEEKADRKYLVGAKGGCYYLNSSGNKSYVKKEFCEGDSITKTVVNTEIKTETNTETNTGTKTETKTDSQPAKSIEKKALNERTYIKGAKGGCYYINKNGNKSYVGKELCN